VIVIAVVAIWIDIFWVNVVLTIILLALILTALVYAPVDEFDNTHVIVVTDSAQRKFVPSSN